MPKMTATQKVDYLTNALKKIQRMNRNGLKAQVMRGDRTGSDVFKIACNFAERLDNQIKEFLALK